MRIQRKIIVMGMVQGIGFRPFVAELAEELKAYYTEVLVDEYQDINDLQEAILQAVSREDNLFMVGDIKQSIYGFRMANPNLFAEKYESFLSKKRICQFRERLLFTIN